MGYKPLTLLLTLFISLAYFSSTPVLCQTAFDLSSICVGARALGMGKTQAVITGIGDAVFNNPAGMGETDHFELTSMSGSVLEDTRYLLFGGVFPFGKQCALGVGYTGAYVSGIALRDANGTALKQCDFGNTLAIIALGKKITDKTSLGLSLKYYSSGGTEDSGGSGAGINLDVGIIQNGLDWLSFGLAGQNILSSGKINYRGGESESLPVKMIAGTKMYLLGKGFASAIPSAIELNATADIHINFSEAKSATLHCGLEFSPSPFFACRTGWDDANLTAGLSLTLSGVGFHYAYHPYGGFSGNVAHYFSLSFNEWNWPPEENPDVFFSRR